MNLIKPILALLFMLAPISGLLFQVTSNGKKYRNGVMGVLVSLLIIFFSCYSIEGLEDKNLVKLPITLFYLLYCLLAFWTMEIKEKVIRRILVIIAVVPIIIIHSGFLFFGHRGICYIIQYLTLFTVYNN